MAGWLRLAGSGRSADGDLVTWTLAEGRRGRRWREVIASGEGIRSSLLLELDPDGRFSHLELSTSHGLLTLHPEGDGTLHGNAVTPAGVEHIRRPGWDPDRAIALVGSSVCAAASPSARTTLRIGLDLSLADGAASFEPGTVDAAGLPRLDGATTWPLEASD
ncbi:MAG TPA: hypothetical protein VFI34_09625 [Candidatus Limnocylindrales bacterium]|nr:hypothetical protein [Candidatus Limnocylindrales bacterium]